MSVQDFESWCKEAYDEIEAGIRAETGGQMEEARKRYLKGMDLIDLALSVPHEGPERVGADWDKLRVTREKIKKTREELVKRITDANVAPPLYPKTVALEKNLVAGVPPSTPSTALTPTEESMAEQLLFIPTGVQVLFITPPDTVQAQGEPGSLMIYKMKTDGEDRCFLKAGHWIYPLLAGHSPVLHSAEGFFVFPDLSAPESNKTVGLMVSNDTPAEVRDLLHDILEQMTQMKDNSPRKPPKDERPTAPPALPTPTAPPALPTPGPAAPVTTGARIADGLVYGAEKVAQGIKWGAAVTSTLLDKTGDKLTSTPQTPSYTPIDPKVLKGLRIARGVSNSAVKVSGGLVSAVGRATMALGRAAAPHVEKHGTRLLTKATGRSAKDAEGTVDTVMDVASGAVKSFSTVFMSLEEGAKIVADSARKNTVTVVTHRYGQDAGAAVNDTLTTMGYAAMTTYNVSNLGVKGIAKQAAKNTGKVILETHRDKKIRGRGGQLVYAPLYPEVQEPEDDEEGGAGAGTVARGQ